MAQKVFCLVLALAGGIFSYFILLRPAFDVIQATRWTPTICVITESGVERGDIRPAMRMLQIRYRYVVDNKEHESRRYSFLPSWLLSGDKVHKIVGMYSNGRESNCYVNPANPDEAVLNRNFSSGMLLGLLGLLLCAMGVGGLGWYPQWVCQPFSNWIERWLKARRSRVRQTAETPTGGEIVNGFRAALVFTGLGIYYLIAAVGDEFSNIPYLLVNVAILFVLTIGYRRRVTLCALALIAYGLILLISSLVIKVSHDAPSEAFSLILRFAPASLVAVLAPGHGLPSLFSAYVEEVAPHPILAAPIICFLFIGTRRLLAEQAVFARAQVAIIGAVTAILVLPMLVAVLQISMRRFVPEPSKTPETMLSEIQSSNAAVRKRGCEAAASLDPLPTHLVPALIRAAQEVEAECRGMCMAALTHAGAAGEAAIPLLVAGTKDSSSYVRLVAADALGAIGSKTGSPEALAAILPLMSDSEDVVRRFAAGAVQQFGPQAREAIPLLRKALSDRSADVRGNAARALKSMSSDAAQAIPELVVALGDAHGDVRQMAAEALGCVGPTGNEAVPALLRSFHDPLTFVRQSAIEAVVKIAPESPEVISALGEALKDGDHTVRGSAIVALENIGPKAAPAVPALIGILSGREIYLRVWAADALAAIGPGARAAVPRLRQMLTEKIVSNESEAASLPEAVRKALYSVEGLSPEQP